MSSTVKILRRRKTKIVATLGPASSNADMLSQLFHAGADVFRLNFSHGSHEDHGRNNIEDEPDLFLTFNFGSNNVHRN